MTISDLIMEGLNLLAIGMSTVLVFLAVLVAVVMLMSKLARRAESLQPKPAEPSVRPTDHAATVAAAAAVRRYRALRAL